MRRRMQIYSQPLTIFSYSIHNRSRSTEKGGRFPPLSNSIDPNKTIGILQA